VEPEHLITQQAYGPLETSCVSVQRQPCYFCAQGIPELHTRLPSSGRNTPSSRVPLQWPVPGPVSEKENAATPCARQASNFKTHRVKLAYVFNEAGITVCNPAAQTMPFITPPAPPTLPPATQTARSGRNVRFPNLATISARVHVESSHMSYIRQTSLAKQRLVDRNSVVKHKLNNKGTVPSGVYYWSLNRK
jgi:hypothetical protein